MRNKLTAAILAALLSLAVVACDADGAGEGMDDGGMDDGGMEEPGGDDL